MTLRDGSTVHVRPLRPDDRPDLAAFFNRLSPDSRAFRFFSAAADIERAATLATDVDYADTYGLVASRGADGRLVGHGTYARGGGDRAEIAFAVAEELQGRGLATILLAHLAEVAQDNGISEFEAEILPENHRMVEVFRWSGFPVEMSSRPGSIRVVFPTSFSPEAIERFEQRGKLAAAAAVSHFLRPKSIAVIGASRNRGTAGGEVFHNLLSGGFEGPVYPVNPAAEVVQSVRAYRAVAELPEEVELAVIAVPAEAVVDAAAQCAEHGVKGLLVISSGFAETGPEGTERQRALVETCRGTGMRLIGPNCLGVLSTVPGASLNATFAPTMPPPGNVGFVSQSGALGLALIDLAADRGLGISSFASVGNRADITANDLLEYWEDDESTDVALLYIESFSDPRRFSRVARRVGRRKPIVAVKSGRSQAGARATSSHTGALLAASDVTVDALFEQVGVIRTDSLAELMDVSALLANQPLPAGRRVGIVTNAGGPGIMCTDACEAAGLEIPALPEPLQGAVREFLPAEASVTNPVDMIATANADHYRRTIAALAEWEGVDSLIVIYVRPLLTRAEDVAAAIRDAIRELPRRIPVEAVFMSAQDHAAMAEAGGIPTYLYPEDAARALARTEQHVRWRAKPAEEPPRFGDTRADEATSLIAEALGHGGGWLGIEQLTRLLACYRILVPEWRTAPDPIAAGRVAEELGGRIALKAVGPGLVHKTDVGAVEVGLSGGAETSWAAVRMDEALERAGVRRERFLVQRMIQGGVEILIGVVSDDVFGPVVACGAGGIQAEILKDVSVGISPLTRHDAREMIRSLAVFPLLTGHRGSPEADIAALEDLVLRISALVDSHHEVAELDLNPVLATERGAVVVDARLRLQSAAPPRPWPSHWMNSD